MFSFCKLQVLGHKGYILSLSRLYLSVLCLQENKIFTIVGPYHSLRTLLKKAGLTCPCSLCALHVLILQAPGLGQSCLYLSVFLCLQENKIFTIVGPYHSLRTLLKKAGLTCPCSLCALHVLILQAPGLYLSVFLCLQENKIFTIVGPYHSLRTALRRRGWVEKFHHAPLPCELSPKMFKKAPTSASTNALINYDLTDGE